MLTKKQKPFKISHLECSSCQLVSINNKVCHEHGCPDAWKDELRKCNGCGFSFRPETKFNTICQDCQTDRKEYNDE
jgi:hypothetical protein